MLFAVMRLRSSGNNLTLICRLSTMSKKINIGLDTDSYQLMQRSKLPTMHFQRSLPRLPIPLLSKTCERFMAAVQPILNELEYSETQKALLNFKDTIGVQLHSLLKQQDAYNKHTSYISEAWFDMYLRDRAPLPLNYNPLLVMKSDTRPDYQQQLLRAANLVISSLRFWRSLLSNQLEPEIYHMNPAKSDTPKFRQWLQLTPSALASYVAYGFKAFPLDMSQYNRLFGVSRIPVLHKDRLVQATDSKHILVLRRGNMYVMQVLTDNGSIEEPHVILARLLSVVSMDDAREAASVPLGILTSGERNDWARTREHLCNGISESNRHLLEQQVDAALFCLCLDTPTDPQYDEADPVPLFKHLLAGESTNRWFDKSVSLLVSADGTTAINFEHSWGDGVAVLRYFNEVFKETLEYPILQPSQLQTGLNYEANSGVKHLDFQVDEKVRAAVDLAKQQTADTVRNLDMHMLRYPHLSKTVCKRVGISPDSLMQLSFQLAYVQAFDEGYVGTYESCSTAAFRHGRTETVRPCTMASKLFCETLLSRKKGITNTPQELLAMLQECSKVHGQLTKEAAMGQGFDRHLFALKNVAQQHNIPIPELYSTEAYRKLNYNIISTSTLSSNALLAGAFGPVVRDGLGIGYSIQNDGCGAIITSYKQQRCGKSFIDSLEKSFNDIRRVIESAK